MAELGPLVDFLPDKFVRSVLARVPARSVCRFRAVSRAWRRLLTDRDFLFEHHRHQPLEPMMAFIHCKFAPGDAVYSRFGVQVLDFRTGETRAVIRSTAVAKDRFTFEDDKVFKVHGSCNGILLLHFHGGFFLCNPATREKARLPPLQSDEVAALYCYAPLEEYRVLYHRGHGADKCYFVIDDPLKKIRAIGCPCSSTPTSASLNAALMNGPSPAWERPPLQLRNSLHWPPQKGSNILVFDTVTEVFSWMSSPVVTQEEQDTAVLIEMDGWLAMSTCRRDALVVELWILRDGRNEIWVRLHRIKLPQELMTRLDEGFAYIGSKDGDVLVSTPQSVLQCNKNGRQVTEFVPEGFPRYVTTHLFKESLVSLNKL